MHQHAGRIPFSLPSDIPAGRRLPIFAILHNMEMMIDSPAPDFEGVDQDGHIRHLADYIGKWLLLYFYPKDFTPGCTTEACAFRDGFAELSKSITIVGVSADSLDSHRKFIAKHDLPFTLLADPDKKIIKAYGADGKLFNKRVSFLIDPQGKIAKIYSKVSPSTHMQEVRDDIDLFIRQKPPRS